MSGPQEQMSSSGFGSSSSLLQGRRFYCREWALDKLRRCLDARSGPGQAPGILVTGGPGAGKTALCTEVVSPTSKAGLAVGLAQRCLAAHFCQREDQTSTVLWRFVLGLVEQLRASPLLSPGYEELLNSPSVSSALEPLTCQRDPNETFKRFVPCLFCLFVFSLFWCPTKSQHFHLLRSVLLKHISGKFPTSSKWKGKESCLKQIQVLSVYVHVQGYGSCPAHHSRIYVGVCKSWRWWWKPEQSSDFVRGKSGLSDSKINENRPTESWHCSSVLLYKWPVWVFSFKCSC